jgi:hypothetical protein
MPGRTLYRRVIQGARHHSLHARTQHACHSAWNRGHCELGAHVSLLDLSHDLHTRVFARRWPTQDEVRLAAASQCSASQTGKCSKLHASAEHIYPVVPMQISQNISGDVHCQSHAVTYLVVARVDSDGIPAEQVSQSGGAVRAEIMGERLRGCSCNLQCTLWWPE